MSASIRLPLLLVIGVVVVSGGKPRKKYGSSSGSSSSSADDAGPLWVENGVCYDRSSFEGVSVLGCDAGKNLLASVSELFSLTSSLNGTGKNLLASVNELFSLTLSLNGAILQQAGLIASLQEQLDSLTQPEPSASIFLGDHPWCEVDPCIPLVTLTEGMPPALTCKGAASEDAALAFATPYCKKISSANPFWEGFLDYSLFADILPFDVTFLGINCVPTEGSDFLEAIACLEEIDEADCTNVMFLFCA